MTGFKFWKMHGAGNDFIVIPDWRGAFPVRAAACIRDLCRRADGIGAQGLIVLRPHRLADVQMRFFNPDGREADMCGNGARCAALLAASLGRAPRQLTLATRAGLVRAEILEEGVRLALPPPRAWRLRLRLTAAGRQLECHAVNTGVPHAVVLVRELGRVNVRKLGAALRGHPAFAPAGTNADFMALDPAGVLHVRTYERGVEDETGACGTGITACALVAGRLGLTAPPVQVVCRHGDRLRVDYRLTARGARDVRLTGPAVIVFSGRVTV